jgi:hypothetical protein
LVGLQHLLCAAATLASSRSRAVERASGPAQPMSANHTRRSVAMCPPYHVPSLPEHVRAPRPSHATQLRMAPRDPNPTTQSWVSFCPSIVCEAQSGGLPGIGHRHSFDVRQNQAKAGLHWTQRRVGVSFHLWEKGAPLAPPVAPQTRRRPPAPHGPTPPLSQHKAREQSTEMSSEAHCSVR